MSELIGNFHFLRPVWLIALVPALLIWWRLFSGRDPRIGLADDIAPHLLDRLVTSPSQRPSVRPVTLLLPIWLIAILAVAGPSFRRQPSPFAEDASQLVLVVKMTPSMLTTDLQPSRLERTRTKLHDLLQSRKGAGTALITYAGTAHLVMPSTSDDSVIDHMLEALDPGIMPADGDKLIAALNVATAQLNKGTKAGSILVVADSVEESQISAFTTWREQNDFGVQILAPLRDDATLSQSGITSAAKALGASVQRVTPDETDIEKIARRADRAIVAAASSDATQWRDDGYYLVPLLAVGILLWCRRGWSLS